MRPLSTSALSLLRVLRRRRGLLDRLLGEDRKAIAALDWLVAHPEAAMVPHLLELACAERGQHQRAALRALIACVADAGADELVELDWRCRESWPYYDYDGRHSSPVTAMTVLEVESGDDRARALGVLSFHPSGYVREEAVRQLSAITSGAELPFLIIRLNDWVDVVADQARGAVQSRIQSIHADAFVDHLPILLRMEAKQRRRQDALVQSVLAMLVQSSDGSAFERGIASDDRRVRRRLFRAAFAANTLDREALLRRALGDADVVIRLHAARCVRDDQNVAHLLTRVLRDRAPAVRAEGIAAAAECGAPDMDTVLMGALTDRSRTVREVGRFYLRRYRQRSDFASIYRKRISTASLGAVSARMLAASIAGLGETGNADDAGVLLPLLDDARPAVRAAAVRALAMLDLDHWLVRLLELLTDASPVVTRQVRNSVAARVGSVSPELLRARIAGTRWPHGRVDGLLLVRRLGKWDAITLLLENMRDREEIVRSAAISGVRRWLRNVNAGFAQPTPAQLTALQSVLDHRRAALEPEVLAELDAVMRFWESTATR